MKKILALVTKQHIAILGWFATLSLLFILMNLTDWILLRLSDLHLTPLFNDTGLILASSDCANNIFHQFSLDTNLAHDCNYNYGYDLLHFFKFFGLTITSRFNIGIALTIILLIILSSLASLIPITQFRDKLVVLIVLFSPPSIFLVERGNFDILMFLLVVVAGYLHSKGWKILSLVPLTFSVLIKFYTLPIFAYFLIKSKYLKQRIFILFILIFLLLRIIPNIVDIQGNFPRNCSASFGNPVLFVCAREIGVLIPDRLQDFLGLVVLFPIYFLSKKFKLLYPASIYTSTAEYLANIQSLIFLSCYFVFINVDYRLIFLIFPALYEIYRIPNGSKLKFRLSVLLVVSLWFGDNAFFLQPFGDIAIMFWVMILGYKWYSLIKYQARIQFDTIWIAGNGKSKRPPFDR